MQVRQHSSKPTSVAPSLWCSVRLSALSASAALPMIATTAALSLTGCAVGPDFKIPLAPLVALTPKPLKAPGSAGGETQRFAHANVQAQRGAFFPTINASYLPSRQKAATAEDLSPPTNSGTPFFTLHTAQLTIAYVPDVFGGNRRQVESLEAQAEAQRLQLEATYLTLTSNIALAAVQEASVRGQIDATMKII